MAKFIFFLKKSIVVPQNEKNGGALRRLPEKILVVQVRFSYPKEGSALTKFRINVGDQGFELLVLENGKSALKT